MLLVGALLAALARRLKTPYPVLLAGFGAVLAFAPNVPDLTIPPELVLALFVAPVLVDAAYDASLRDLRDNWRPVANLALVTVFLTIAGVAIVVHWLVPDIPWAVAVTLGAIVAPPDASAATAVLSELRPPHRVMVILEGESLFNDASALLIYRVAIGVVMTGRLYGAIPGMAFAAVGSAVLGLSLGRLYMVVSDRLQHIATTILMQFLSVFLVWILAERLGLSGIITIVCYAIMVAQISPTQTHARLRIPSYAVWEVVVFILNLLVFILVGLQLKPLLQRLNQAEIINYLAVGAAVCATTILIRIAWVMTYNTLVRWKNKRYGANLPRPMMLPTFQRWLDRLLVRNAWYRNPRRGSRPAGWPQRRAFLSLSRPFAILRVLRGPWHVNYPGANSTPFAFCSRDQRRQNRRSRSGPRPNRSRQGRTAGSR